MHGGAKSQALVMQAKGMRMHGVPSPLGPSGFDADHIVRMMRVHGGPLHDAMVHGVSLPALGARRVRW